MEYFKGCDKSWINLTESRQSKKLWRNRNTRKNEKCSSCASEIYSTSPWFNKDSKLWTSQKWEKKQWAHDCFLILYQMLRSTDLRQRRRNLRPNAGHLWVEVLRFEETTCINYGWKVNARGMQPAKTKLRGILRYIGKLNWQNDHLGPLTFWN